MEEKNSQEAPPIRDKKNVLIRKEKRREIAENKRKVNILMSKEIREEIKEKIIRTSMNEIGDSDLLLPRSFIKTKLVEQRLIEEASFIPNKNGDPEHFVISQKRAREIAKEVFTEYFDTKKI
jgi:hypothetical protein